MQAAGWLGPWWKTLPKRWGHPWHSMCSYLAMFPPSLPRYFIEQCSKPGEIVLDPFSGRGTAPLEACLAGRIGAGSDANPLAALLTAAKVDPPTLEQSTARVDELRQSYKRRLVTHEAPREIAMLFDGRRTLPQLLHARSLLSQEDTTDRHLLAVLCGILHGNHPHDAKQSRTLSISMPNTFSMSPNYIEKYVRKHHLRKIPFDVFALLDRRLKHLHRDDPPPTKGLASRLDARHVDTWLQHGSVSLIISSPPYLRVVRYGKYNWIRLWLLQESVQEVDKRLRVEATDTRLSLSDQLKFPAYCEFLEATLSSCQKLLRPGGTCVLVIGDVDTPDGEHINLAWEAWKHLRKTSSLKLAEIIEDSLESSGKVTRIWGSRKGNATKTDRILVLSNPGGKRHRPKRPSTVLATLLH